MRKTIAWCGLAGLLSAAPAAAGVAAVWPCPTGRRWSGTTSRTR